MAYDQSLRLWASALEVFDGFLSREVSELRVEVPLGLDAPQFKAAPDMS